MPRGPLSQKRPTPCWGNQHERALIFRAIGALATCALPSILAVVLFSTHAEAAVYRCATATGNTQFQDTPCSVAKSGSGQVAEKAVTSSNMGGLTGRPLPAAMHASWFEPPAGIAYETLCDATRCECGPMEKHFDNGLQTAVGDALYLDGSWHRYDKTIQQLVDATRGGDRAAARQYQAEIEDTACEILISQQILMRFAQEELADLRRDAQNAEDLGRNDESSCDGFSETACNNYQQWLAYQSMVADAHALSLPRVKDGRF